MLTLFNISIDGEVYSIQHYVIKFVSALRQEIFFRVLHFLHQYTNKADRNDITVILLKVASNTISLDLHLNQLNGTHYLRWRSYIIMMSMSLMFYEEINEQIISKAPV